MSEDIKRSAQQRFLAAISGQGPGSRGVGPAALRLTASAASMVYGLVICSRNRLYDWRLLPIRSLARPVISVGNLSAGGTGKTVLVAEIARWILQAGRQPAILIRGYKATPTSSSDEAVLLGQLLPGVPVEADPDRYAAGRRLLAKSTLTPPSPSKGEGFEVVTKLPDLFILDDGFQHRRLHRDLDIVTIDATMLGSRPGQPARLLPRGLLREPFSSLQRADCIVLTRADQAEPAAVDDLLGRVAAAAPGVPVVRCRHAARSLRLAGKDHPLSELAGRRYLAFCGIGNPAAFRRTLAGLPGECVEFVAFDDHHAYREPDLADLLARARASRADALVTTRKDQVKLDGGDLPAGPPIYAVHVELDWLDEPTGQPLRDLVLDLLKGSR